MTQRFVDRVIIITGASSGFGLKLAQAFAAEGAKLVLAARNLARLDEVIAPLRSTTKQKIVTVACDVFQRPTVDQMIATAIAEFGRIDILINNAGTGLIAPFELIQVADAVRLFETNFFGALNCAQAVLPQMKKQKDGQIINMSSVAGLRGIPNSSMYCASKAALISFSDSLRLEVRRHGVSVTTICPSRTPLADTNFFANAKTYGNVELYKLPETLTVERVIKEVLDAAAKRKRMVIVPFHARLMDTVNKFMPSYMDNYLYKRMPMVPHDAPKG